MTTGPTQWVQPVPSRDGHTIFAVGQTLRGELSRWDKATGQFQPYLGGISAEEVLFSRDGKSVAWVTYPDGDGARRGVRAGVSRPGAAPITATPSFSIGTPRKLFAGTFTLSGGSRSYDVAPDGRRFIMVKPGEQPPLPESQIVVVQNWSEELKRIAPAK